MKNDKIEEEEKRAEWRGDRERIVWKNDKAIKR